jgi:hypothetical protein
VCEFWFSSSVLRFWLAPVPGASPLRLANMLGPNTIDWQRKISQAHNYEGTSFQKPTADYIDDDEIVAG